MSDVVRKLTGETRSKLLDLLRRSPRTITELAEALEMTDNAVRTHIAGMSRDGLVAEAGSQRDTGGKPARLYALTPTGEELYPKAYAIALNGLVEEIAAKQGWDKAVELLRGVGTRAASDVPVGASLDGRMQVAADTLRSLGAEIDLERSGKSWELRGYACPLAAVTSTHPQVCALVTAIVSEIAGRPATERCEHGPLPRCRFAVSA